MDWFGPVDAYCERQAQGFGGEPLNMLTGLAFLVVGLMALRRAPSGADRMLALALALVGVASAVQHGFALVITVWADLAANILYLVLLGSLMLRRLAGISAPAAILSASAMVLAVNTAPAGPALRAVSPILADTFFLLLLILAGSALALRHARPETARGFAVAAMLLAIGLPFRLLDGGLCPVWPIGTHWIWHLLNAASATLVLAALARQAVLPSAMLAKVGAGR